MSDVRIKIYNRGGTLGMNEKGEVVETAKELIAGITLPSEIQITLEDPKRRDSTNCNLFDRLEMAESIARDYNEQDAFVFFHGTDTLELTAAYLSMIFKSSLQKPVYIVAAQKKRGETGTDVPLQIANGLRAGKVFHRKSIAGIFSGCVGKIFDGTRIRKKNESALEFLYTPGKDPVAHAWPHMMVTGKVRRMDPVLCVQGLRMDTKFERAIPQLEVDADVPGWILERLADDERLKGVILVAKGCGNIPDREWDAEQTRSWIDAIKYTTEREIPVAILSPFDDGRVDLERYDLGRAAKEAGALSLESLTPAMARAKFGQAIAMHGFNPPAIQQFLSVNIMGELLEGEIVD